MPSKSELDRLALNPSHPTRLSKAIAQASGEDALAFLTAWKKNQEVTDDHTSAHPLIYVQTKRLEYDFYTFYEKVWPMVKPDEPEDPWEATSSKQLADRITAFCLYRLDHRKSARTGEVVLVTAKTLFAWLINLDMRAAYEIRGLPAKTHPNRLRVAYTGEPGAKGDSLIDHLMHWRSATIENRDMTRGLLRKSQFYGPVEVALCVDNCIEKIHYDAASAGWQLQMMTMINLVFLTLSRPGAFTRPTLQTSSNFRQTLHNSDITIRQCRQKHCWEIEISFRWLKGYTASDDEGIELSPVLPPIRRIGNIRFEVLCSLVPLLINDGVLCRNTRHGKIPLKDIEEFISATDAEFVVVDPKNLAVFRSSDRSSEFGGGRSEEPLRGHPAAAAFSRLSQDVGLPDGRLYCMRHGGGEKMRIVDGAEVQREALNHALAKDPSKKNYNRPLLHIGVARVQLGEFREGDEQRVENLSASEWIAVQENGPAVQAVHRMLSGQEVEQKWENHQRTKRKRIDAEGEKEDQDLVKLKRELKKAKSEGDKKNEKRLGILKRKRKNFLDTRRKQWKDIDTNAALREKAEMSMEEREAAIHYINNLLDKDPLSEILSTSRIPPTMAQGADDDGADDDGADDDGADNPLDPLPSLPANPADLGGNPYSVDDGEVYFELDPEDFYAEEQFDAEFDDEDVVQEDLEYELPRHLGGNAPPGRQGARRTGPRGEVPATSTNFAEHPLREFHLFDESDDVEDEDGTICSPEVVAARLARLRWAYSVLTVGKLPRKMVEDWMDEKGWCPLCELSTIGFACQREDGGARGFWAPLQRGIVAHKTHLLRVHPAETDQLRAGFLPQIQSELWDVEMTDEETARHAEMLQQMIDSPLTAGSCDKEDFEQMWKLI